MISVLGINLDRSPERWEQLEASCRALDLSLDRVPAVDAARNGAALDTAQDPADSRHFDALKRTEIACFLSHRAAWAHVVRTGTALVVEDDAVLDAAVLPWLAAERLSHVPAGAVLRLYAKRTVRGREVAAGMHDGTPWRIVRPALPPLGLVAQVVTPECAAALLAATGGDVARVREPVDIALQRWWETGVDAVVADPAPVREGSAGLGGTTLRPDGGAGRHDATARRRPRPDPAARPGAAPPRDARGPEAAGGVRAAARGTLGP